MNAASPNVNALRAPDPLVRSEVQKLLTKSEGFQKLDPKTRTEVAKATAQVADFLAKPDGIPGNTIQGGVGMPAESMFFSSRGTENDKSAKEKSEQINSEFVKFE